MKNTIMDSQQTVVTQQSTMFDLKTLTVIKKIKIPAGGLDGIMYDDFSDHVILTNHSKPGTATAIDPKQVQ